MKTLEYIDAAKEHLGIKSDYALAIHHLKCSDSTISNYRSGRSRMDDETATKIAKILGIEPLEIIAAANLERAKTDEMKAIWGGLLEKMHKGFDDLLPTADPHGDCICM